MKSRKKEIVVSPSESSSRVSLLKSNPFFYFIKSRKKHFLLGSVFLLLTNLLDIAHPLLLAYGIDAISQKQPMSELLKITLFFFALLSSVALCRFGWRIFWGQFHNSVAEDLRNEIYFHLTKMSPSFFSKNPTGQLMSLIINDVQAFQRAIGPGVLIFLDACLLTVMTLPIMIYLSWDWTWKTLILLPFLPFVMRKIMTLIHIGFKKQQEKFADISAVAQEIVTGIRVIKSFAQEKSFTQLFNKESKTFENTCNQVARIDALFSPVMQFAVASGSVILLYIASPQVMTETITIGTFVAFHRYIQKMVWPMTAFGMGLSMIQRGRASFSRIQNILSQESEVPDTGTQEVTEFKTLEIKNLSFYFPNQSLPALKNINLKITAGQTIGVVGSIGSGKSILAQLFTHLYPLPRKTFFINDVDINDITLKSLRDLIVLIPQDPFLFSETVSNNIAYGLDDEPTFKEIYEQAKIVLIEKEISTMPYGFDSELGEKGVNLSGGQKQRLTIARALIRQSPFVIFDDVLSAVDAQTEQSIENAILKAKTNKTQTRLIITHRISSVKKADQIIVMKNGLIESIGTHHELLVKSPTYNQLYITQVDQNKNTSFATPRSSAQMNTGEVL